MDATQMEHCLADFNALAEAWAIANDDIQSANNLNQSNQSSLDFVCHHNAYIAQKSFRYLGIENTYLVSGLYCAGSDTQIEHSWIAFPNPKDPVVIFEYDPNQLKIVVKLNYDEMRGGKKGDKPDKPLISSVVIVDTSRIEYPNYPYIIDGGDILARYSSCDIDFNLPETQLDDLFNSVLQFKQANADLFAENDP